MENLTPIIMISISIVILFFLLYLARANLNFIKKYLWTIISYLILVLIFFVTFNNIHFIKEIINISTMIFINEYVLFMCACGLSIITVVPIVAIIQKIRENSIIKQYESKYIFEKYEYYREIVGNIPPAMLSVIYNRRINMEDQIIATIVYLKEKQVISLENGKITMNDSYNQLSNHEKNIIEYVTNKIDYSNFCQNYSISLLDDLKNQGYIIVKSNDIFDMTEFMQLIALWIIISLIIFMPAIVSISNIGILLTLAYAFAFLSIPIYKYIAKKINPVIRTNKSLELSSKLNGLKIFLQNFTIINDRKIEEIKIYDDYILYGIIFDFKGLLNNESKKIYNNIKTSLKK